MPSTSLNHDSLSKKLLGLYTPVVSDVLDQLGVTDNTMASSVTPSFDGARLAGPAFTARAEFFAEYKEGEDFTPLVEMMSAVSAHEVVVTATGGKMTSAVWGELMSHSARNSGAVGALTDGAVRDVPAIVKMKPRFPVFSAGYCPADSLGRSRIVETGKTIQCGGLRVRPGDYVFGDRDGVVVIPKEKVEEAIGLAQSKMKTESEFRASIKRGMSLRAAVDKYKTM